MAARLTPVPLLRPTQAFDDKSALLAQGGSFPPYLIEINRYLWIFMFQPPNSHPLTTPLAVNRLVAGSNPARGANINDFI
jgi:hypothetical protein